MLHVVFRSRLSIRSGQFEVAFISEHLIWVSWKGRVLQTGHLKGYIAAWRVAQGYWHVTRARLPSCPHVHRGGNWCGGSVFSCLTARQKALKASSYVYVVRGASRVTDCVAINLIRRPSVDTVDGSLVPPRM